jgi:capsular exopolysaccharide synthesis family protein
VGVLLLTLGFGAWVSYRAIPTYEALTSIRIESPDSKPAIVSDLGGSPGWSSWYIDPISTEIQMLKSRSLAEDVVHELALNVTIVEPKIRRSRAVDSVALTGHVRPGTYALVHRGDSWSLRRGGRIVSQARSGEPLQWEGLVIQPRSPSESGTRRIVLNVAHLRDAAAAFLGKLTVTVPVRDTNILRVSYRDSDPEVAQAAVNGLATRFIDRSFAASRSQARGTREFIEGQLAQLATELKRSEEELQNYKEQANIVALSAEAEQGIENFARLEVERDRFITERNALIGLLEEGASSGQRNDSDISTFPSFIENEAVQHLKTQLNELESKQSLLMAEKTATHPDVVAVQKQIDQLRASLSSAANGYRAALDSKIKALNQTLGTFEGQLSGLPEKEVQLARLLRAQKVTEELYTTLQMKHKEAQITEAMQMSSIRVVDPAIAPDTPISPNKRRNLMLAGLVGLLLGCGAAFGREYFDNTLRTKEHVETQLRLSMMGVIPEVESGDRMKKVFANGRRSVPKASSDTSPATATASDPLLLTHLPQYSPAVEAFRALRTNLVLLPVEQAEKRMRVILVTSPQPSEGKTFVAANLAISFALQGTRTMLVDCDMRKGVLYRRFGVSRRKGLSDYLSGRASLREILRETELEKLYLIPSGTTPPLPTELLGSEKMDVLLGALGSQIEVLILDSPPILPVADAMVLASRVNDVLLVIRSRFTDRAAAADALSLLGSARSSRVTCVLNGMDFSEAYGYGHYTQYTQGYYGDLPEEPEANLSADQQGPESDSIIRRARGKAEHGHASGGPAEGDTREEQKHS